MNETDNTIVLDVPRNTSFVPWDQPFDLLLQDGRSNINTGVPDVNQFISLAVFQAITNAIQIGAAGVLLLTIFLMTKNEKRRSAVFFLNVLSLLLVVLRGSFQLATVTGPFYEFFRWKTQTYIELGNAKAISACGEVSSLLLTIAILLSLFVQVQIVCCNLGDMRRYAINISNGVIIAAAVAMRFAATVVNIRWNILDIEGGSYYRFVTIGRLASGANITLVLSIAFSTVIFTVKLAAAIIARRSMGMKQFGPMQIIFVMGCQTMFTPLIFTILCYTAVKNANIQSFVPVIVAITLPLSGMWAAVNTDNVHIASPNQRKHRAVPLGASTFTGSGSSKAPLSTSTSTYYDDEKYGLQTPTKKHGRADSDVEMQKIDERVNVERSYSVRSD